MNTINKFKQARVNASMTQKKAAEQLQINVRTLASYESGRLLPPLDKIEALAKLYNVPVTYLVADPSSEMDSVKQWLISLSKNELTELQSFINNCIENASE